MFSQMSEIEFTITTLKNGIRVINLMGKDLTFTCGTVCKKTKIPPDYLKNMNMARDYDFDRELVGETVGKEIVDSGEFKLMKRHVVPNMTNYRRIMKAAPKDCIILVREYIAESCGFPFVCPMYHPHWRNYRPDCFYGA